MLWPLQLPLGHWVIGVMSNLLIGKCLQSKQTNPEVRVFRSCRTFDQADGKQKEKLKILQHGKPIPCPLLPLSPFAYDWPDQEFYSIWKLALWVLFSLVGWLVLIKALPAFGCWCFFSNEPTLSLRDDIVDRVRPYDGFALISNTVSNYCNECIITVTIVIHTHTRPMNDLIIHIT